MDRRLPGRGHRLRGGRGGRALRGAGETEYTGFAEAFRMDGAPGEGAEVFSLMRESDLPSGAYVGTFYATGRERTG
ncbi:hypothetical protein OG981_21720 [Streptomyces mirabilis]|uniref:hypothetical protein n=1 Tax=Streptomyces mirabilis TaxID=68239 RepID=UPI002E24E5E7